MSEARAELRELPKHFSIYAFGIAMQRAAGVLLLPLYTRYLTPRDYGIEELVSIATGVIGVILATSISVGMARFYFEEDTPQYRDSVVGTIYWATGVVLGITSVTLALFADWTATKLLDSAEWGILVRVAAAAMWFNIINGLSRDYLRINLQSTRYVIISMIQLLSAVGLNIYFVAFLRIGVLGILLSSLITSVLAFFLMTAPIMIRTRMRFSLSLLRSLVHFGLPMVPAQLSAFVVHLSDRFFIKHYVSIADAGLYSLGYRLGNFPQQLIGSSFNQTWLPRRFKIYKDPESGAVFTQVFTMYVLLLTFGGLAVSVLARDMLQLIAAPEFWSAHRIVPLIAIAGVLFPLHYQLDFGLLLAKKTHIIAAINVGNAGFILALSFLLIPRFGIYGAAVATILAFVFKVTLTFFLSQRHYRIQIEVARICKIVLAAALIYLVSLFVNVGQPAWNALLRGMLVMTYPVLLWSLRFFTPGEWSKFRRETTRLKRLVA